jgi:hypothetical protein
MWKQEEVTGGLRKLHNIATAVTINLYYQQKFRLWHMWHNNETRSVKQFENHHEAIRNSSADHTRGFLHAA